MSDWKSGFIGKHRLEDVGRYIGPTTSAVQPCGRCKKFHPLWLNCGLLERNFRTYSSAKEHQHVGHVRARATVIDGFVVLGSGFRG